MKNPQKYSYGQWFLDDKSNSLILLVQTGPGRGQLIGDDGNRYSDESFDIGWPGKTVRDIQAEYHRGWQNLPHGKLKPVSCKIVVCSSSSSSENPS